MLKQLWNDEAGLILSAELVLVLTIGVLAMIVGLHAVAKSVTQELNDLSSAIGAIDQSFEFDGFKKDNKKGGPHARWQGSGFRDNRDECDCTVIVQTRPRVKRDRGHGSEAGGGFGGF